MNKDIRREVKLARYMEPVREEWEKLGFEFTNTSVYDGLYDAKLPIGWNLIKDGRNTNTSYIIDDLGNIRGEMLYNECIFREDMIINRDASMTLYRRYDIHKNYEKDNIIEVYFGNPMEKLFATQCAKLPETPVRLPRRNPALDKCLELVRAFADENYPGWEDYDAYWNSLEETKGKTK